jgi:hypothetical protein
MRPQIVVASAALAASFLLTAQNPPSTSKAPAKTFTPPKTPWGDPDLQGLWPGAFAIPLERDKSFGSRIDLTPQELADRQKKQKKNTNNFGIENFPLGPQTSLLIDPPDGRMPAMTPEATKRMKELRDGLGPPTLFTPEGRANWTDDFDLWGRCITKGLIGSMLPGNLYNKGNQIVQAPGYVVIRNEMVHENRIIPLDKRPHVSSAIRTYMGDGRGHWEGNVLVVETTNFRDNMDHNGCNHSHTTEQLKIVERLERTAADSLKYEMTVSDPGTWVKPWTMRIPFKMDDTYTLYEYACHEANYDLLNILKGAREDEAAGKTRQQTGGGGGGGRVDLGGRRTIR